MYRVLLADDEQIVLQGMQTFDWEAYGCQVVGSAQDGEEAWNLVQTLHPDVVITDIRMPVMDGLALSHAITEFDPFIAILIITGFTEFSYAREALQIGVVDLLVKPIGIDSLGDGVSKAIGWLNSKRKVEELSQTMQRTLPYVKEQVLLDGLRGKVEGNEKLVSLTEMEEQSCIVVSLACDELDGLKATVLRSLLSQFCAEHGGVNLYEYHRYCMLFLFPENKNRDECQCEVKQWLECLQADAWNEYHISFSVGISSCSSGLFSLPMLRKQSLKCLYQGQQAGKSMIVCHGDNDQGSLPLQIFLPMRVELFSALQSRDEQALEKALAAMHTRMEEEKDAITLYHALWVETAWSLSFPLKEVLDPEEVKDPGTYLQKLEEYLRQLLQRLQVRDLESGQEIEVVVRNYINAHYAQEISLTTLSEKLCYNTAYLSRLVTKTCGQSFMKMLTGKRMERAKELLSSSREPVCTVARMVGYNDVGYFITTFRKHEGYTPLEYRESNAT